MSRSTPVSVGSLGLLSRTVEPIDRLGQVVGLCRFIDGESHRFSPNVLYEDLTDHFVQVQLRTAVGESRAKYLPARQQARE